MKITGNAYEAIVHCLEQIERTAIRGAIEGNAAESCRNIKELVHETKQVLNENFYLLHCEA